MGHGQATVRNGRGKRRAAKVRRGGWALMLGWLLIGAGPLCGQEADPKPEAASKTAPLARFAPRDDLIAYLEFEGLDAHADAWKKSATYKLLNDTKLGPLIEDLALQVLERLPISEHLKPADAMAIFKHFAKHGGLWTAREGDGGRPDTVFVVRNGDRPEIRRLLGLAERHSPDQPGTGKARQAARTIAGRALHSLNTDRLVWWFEKDDLVLTTAPELIIEVLDGKKPSAVDHPLRAALLKSKAAFRPFAAGFLDMENLPGRLPPDAVKLGLGGVKRIELQWGVRDDELMTVLNAVAPAPRRGVLAMLDQPAFDVRSLPPIPADQQSFTVFSVDFLKLYRQTIDQARRNDPQAGQGFEQLENAMRQRFGVELQKDLLASLGPKVAFYVQTPKADGAPAFNPLAAFSGLTLAVQVRGEALERVIGPMIDAVNRMLQAQQAGARNRNPNQDPVLFRKLGDERPTYELELPPVNPIVAMFQPTLQLGKNQLVFAATTDAARQANDLAEANAKLWKAEGAFSKMANHLPDKLVFLDVHDPRDTLPAFVQALPMIVAQANMMFPAVQAARGAARRAQCVNNLRQIAIAHMNFVDSTTIFAPSAIADKNGKPLLSWRVAILPYIDQQPLYNRFHLDEPWDSPHNKALVPLMPKTFVCPERTDAEPGKTDYQVFVGKGTIFEPGQKVGLQDVTDGTSPTILVVEAKEPVIWTKPDDLKFDPKAEPSLYGAASGRHGNGFNAIFADASCRFLADSIDAKLFRDVITRNGGERVDLNALDMKPTPAARGGAAGVLRVKRELMPTPNELMPHLFPGSLALEVDKDGARFIARDSFPIMSSPGTSATVAALLLPAVQAAREAARRAQCTNNLKQMALAMHNYHSANNTFPMPTVPDKNGKRHLSWRVTILPYIEHQALYNRFHLDEPWDSPHNKALIKEMPETYRCPSRTKNEPGTTTYRVFVGNGAMFQEGQATRIQNITDGTSNTIMIAEADEAVIWTRPDELEFDPRANQGTFGAGSSHPGGFNAAFADGAVRFIKRTIDLNTLKALITRAGGEVIRADSF